MEKYLPYIKIFLGGLAAALAVAGPIVDDGLTPSEVITIVNGFLAGLGLTAVPVNISRK